LRINNPKIWTLTDGSQGMISQTRGLAFEFTDDIKEINTEVLFPWSKIQPGFLPVYKWIFRNKLPNIIPEIVISCGRKSVYLSIYLKKKYPKMINIHIQNPKVSSKYFSFIVAPNHDNFFGENVINSIGAIHNFKDKKKFKEGIDFNNEKLVSCIIGGENNHYKFDLKEANNLCDKICELKNKNRNLEFLIITSRRTNNHIKKLIKDKLGLVAKLWLGERRKSL